jgi:hypothetical protein
MDLTPRALREVGVAAGLPIAMHQPTRLMSSADVITTSPSLVSVGAGSSLPASRSRRIVGAQRTDARCSRRCAGESAHLAQAPPGGPSRPITASASPHAPMARSFRGRARGLRDDASWSYHLVEW